MPLSDGDFLTVKKELNAGEYIDLLTDGAAGKYFAKQLAYLVSWTLVGAGDTPIPYSLMQSLDDRRDVLRSLDTATMVEIVAAINAHEAANEIAIAEKNNPRTRSRIVTNLALCRITGLSYDDVRSLPREVYEVLIEDLNAQTEKAEALD